MEIAGRVITEYCAKLLLETGHSFTSSAEMEIVKSIKEQLCFVSADYEAQHAESQESSSLDEQFELPDKRTISVKGNVRIQTPELIFKPELNGKSCKSIQHLAWESISTSDIDTRKELMKNVIMSGGTTMYDGMADRLKAELTSLAYAGSEIRIIAPADRKYSVWKGASTLASLSTFATKWITKADFEEHGEAIVHRKCN